MMIVQIPIKKCPWALLKYQLFNSLMFKMKHSIYKNICALYVKLTNCI